jgi:hypothetical protein
VFLMIMKTDRCYFLCNINQVIFIMGERCVFFEVRKEFLNNI